VEEDGRKNNMTVIQEMLHDSSLVSTDDDILWNNSDLDCPDIKSNLEESVDSECETGYPNEEDNE
jgi:hypothetical protein